jgi:hypothetical protein
MSLDTLLKATGVAYTCCRCTVKPKMAVHPAEAKRDDQPQLTEENQRNTYLHQMHKTHSYLFSLFMHWRD